MRRRTLQPLGYSSAMTAGAAAVRRPEGRRVRWLVVRPFARRSNTFSGRPRAGSSWPLTSPVATAPARQGDGGAAAGCVRQGFGGKVDQDTNKDTSRPRDVHIPGIEQKNPTNKRCQFFKRPPSPPCRCCRRCRCSPSQPPQSNRIEQQGLLLLEGLRATTIGNGSTRTSVRGCGDLR